MKVYLSGTSVGSYRAQNIIKSFLDGKIDFVYFPQLYFKPRLKLLSLNRFIYALCIFFTIPIRIYLIALSNCLFLLPMNAGIVTAFDILIAKLFGKKIIVDFYISQYDTLVNDRKVCSKKSWGARKAYFKDRFLMKFSDRLIFLNKAESVYYHDVVAVNVVKNKVVIVPLCVDYRKEVFQEPKVSLSDELNICWWGTYIPLHGLKVVFDALKLLNEPRIKLYLFGDSDKKAIPYKALVNDLGLSEIVHFEHSFSFSNGKLAPELMRICDISLGNFGDSIKARTVLVNKVIDSLSLGLPCLTIETLACKELLEEGKGVIYCEPEVHSIAAQIKKCHENKTQLRSIGKAGQEIFFEKFSYDSFSLQMHQLIRN